MKARPLNHLAGLYSGLEMDTPTRKVGTKPGSQAKSGLICRTVADALWISQKASQEDGKNANP